MCVLISDISTKKNDSNISYFGRSINASLIAFHYRIYCVNYFSERKYLLKVCKFVNCTAQCEGVYVV